MFTPGQMIKLFKSATTEREIVQRDLRLIERERLLIDPTKVVSVQMFFNEFIGAGENRSWFQCQNAQRSTQALFFIGWLQTQYEGLPLMAIYPDMRSEEFHKEVGYTPSDAPPVMTMSGFGLAGRIDDEGKIHTFAQGEDGALKPVILFQHLGHVLSAYDRVTNRDNFKSNIKTSVALGFGADDLQMWRNINGLINYRGLFPSINYDPPKGGNSPKFEEAHAPVFKPAFNS